MFLIDNKPKFSSKSAFTLIELLAVIILLAIIAVIAVPIVLNIIKEARKSAGLSEANMIYNGINNYCIMQAIEHELNGTIDICADGVTIAEVKDMVNLGNAIVKDIVYENGKITILVVESNNREYTLSNDKMVIVPETVSFAVDSWETIIDNIKSGNANVYNVGDTKEVKLTNYTNGLEETFTIRVANNSMADECYSEMFSQTACGFVIEFVDIITTYKMNSTNTNLGGWPGSEMYDFINNNIYNSLPSELQKLIIDTYTISSHGSTETNNFTSNNKLYLLTLKEIWGDIPNNYDTVTNQTRQLDYYKKEGVNSENYAKAIKDYQGNPYIWWLRSANFNSDTDFYRVSTLGLWPNRYATAVCGVAPAFRIG